MAVTPFQLTEPFSMDGFNSRISEINTMFGGLGNEYVWAKSDSTGIVGYVNSPDENAYPPAVSDGYTYMPLGKLGAKVQIATGSYTGTGTYGSSNPNSLTFDFEPKIVFIVDATYNEGMTYMLRGQKKPITGTGSGAYIETTWSGNTVTWYQTNVTYQLNYSGRTYLYLAIG